MIHSFLFFPLAPLHSTAVCDCGCIYWIAIVTLSNLREQQLSATTPAKRWRLAPTMLIMLLGMYHFTARLDKGDFTHFRQTDTHTFTFTFSMHAYPMRLIITLSMCQKKEKQRKQIIYRCRYSKDVRRTKCQALTSLG